MSCFSALHALAVRATRLNADGTPATGPGSSYVTNHPMRFAFNPEIEEGDDLTMKNGAGCVCASYKGPDQVKRWNLELDNCRVEYRFVEMAVGADVIPGAEEGDVAGILLPSGVEGCGADVAGIGLEIWTRAWDGDRPATGTPYMRIVVPKTVWQLGDNEIGSEFLTVSMTGFSENNPGFGDPYGDMPASYVNASGVVAVFNDAGPLPTAACDYAETGSGSGSGS